MPARLYAWDEWFEQGVFTLHKGQDYDCSQSAMYGQILTAASKRGIRVTVKDEDTSITVTVRQPSKVP